MIRIDPHTHSACSDGTDTPAQLMMAASRVGLDVVGLTDHDTTAGWEDAAAMVERTGVALMRGIEMSTASNGISAHVLAYMPAPLFPELVETMRRSRESREERARKIVQNLSADFPITWGAVVAQTRGENVPVGRPHIADALVEAGVFPDRGAAFDGALHPSLKYYVHYWAPDPVDTVRLIRRAGGVPVLAHPRARARQRILSEDVIADMAEAGLFGLERDHRDHDAAAREEVERIADRLGLHVTGSSDYHGQGKPNQLGENLTSEYVYRAVEEQASLEVVRP